MDERLIAMAQIAGLVSDAQVAEAEGLCERLKAEGVVMTLSEALIKKGHLSSGQLAELDKKRRTEQFAESIPGYRMMERLGAGAMGSVFKAYQKSMDRTVAIKILNPNLAGKPGFAERFRREAHASAKISHSHIIAGLDVGESNGLNYFVMEFVDGEPLSARLSSGNLVGIDEGVHLAQQLASALLAIEQAGMVHRDLKPANIMVNSKGVAKICDLGLSKLTSEDSSLTQSGYALGTPFYVAPEQARGDKDIDARADQYALGATLYHLFTGKPLFTGETAAATMTAHVVQTAVHPQSLRPDLPNGVVAILRKMCAKQPTHRYNGAAALIQDLEDFKQGRPVSAFLFQEPSSIPPGFVQAGVDADLAIAAPLHAAAPAPAPSGGKTTRIPAGRGATSRHAPVPDGLAPLPRPRRRGERSAESKSHKAGLIIGGAIFALVAVAGLLVYLTSKGMDEAQEAHKRPELKPPPLPAPPSTSTPPAAKTRTVPKPPPERTRPPATSSMPGSSRELPKVTPPGQPEAQDQATQTEANPSVTAPEGDLSAPNEESVTQPPPATDPEPEAPTSETAQPAAAPELNTEPAAASPEPAPANPAAVETPLKQQAGPWLYAFDHPTELTDWTALDDGWLVAQGALISESKGLIQGLVWNRELEGDVTVSFSGYTRSDLGIGFSDAERNDRQDRIVIGGSTGNRVGIAGKDKAAIVWKQHHIADGQRHEIVVRRSAGKISVSVDGKELASADPATLHGAKRFKVVLYFWEAGGVIEDLKIEAAAP
ncbi:MAG: hypothetical protein AMXMBFR7_49050 [Planctomycetota bacterium]